MARAPLPLEEQQNRMACLLQAQLQTGADPGHLGFDGIGKRAMLFSRSRWIRIASCASIWSASSRIQAADLPQDADLFHLLFGGQVLQFIGQSDDLQRLHEGGLAGVGNVVHHARDLALGIHAHRDDPSPAPLGDEIVLEEDGNIPLPDNLLEPFADARRQGTFPGAQIK